MEVHGLLGKPRLSLKDNIEIDLKEVGWNGMDWINLAWYRDWWWGLVNMVMNLLVP